MSLAKEFKEFIARGNVIDLAVGVIVGAAFGNIVKSLTDDVIMPPIGKAMGGVGGLNFQDYFVPLDWKFGVYKSLADARAHTAVVAYGSFVTIVIQFLIVAACVFLLVKVVNRLKRQEAAAPPVPARSEVLLEEIRDLLKSK
ncbi:MAG: large conductance mechanosensitive channel protein MscL [Terrimicrobiaceae bacterium]|nr:large conductance mechanosensitive channel protein MscL [Terrimicrobiaceae bacterium]